MIVVFKDTSTMGGGLQMEQQVCRTGLGVFPSGEVATWLNGTKHGPSTHKGAMRLSSEGQVEFRLFQQAMSCLEREGKQWFGFSSENLVSTVDLKDLVERCGRKQWWLPFEKKIKR